MRSLASRLRRGARTRACRAGNLADARCAKAKTRRITVARSKSTGGKTAGVTAAQVFVTPAVSAAGHLFPALLQPAGSVRALVLVLAASAASFAQAVPPADQNSASVEGVVVNEVTGDPVPRAHVALFMFARGKQQNYGAITTVEGKFSVTGLSEGSYNISADRVGFLVNPRGQNGFSLKPGDHKNDVKVKLAPTGAIEGTVVDADGEPVESCSVLAESSRGSQGSQSDAQGKFRIGGLAPGKYQIKATPDEPRTPPEIRTDGTAEAHYSETYYPSALDAPSGGKVNVAPGGETAGIEIRLVRTLIVRVSGKVTGMPQGAENVFVTVQKLRNGERGRFGDFPRNAGWGSSAAVKKDGTFALWRLAPGSYRIGAQWNNAGAPAMASAPAEIAVGDSNVDGIELRMMAAADVTGQVEYESDDAKPLAPAEQSRPVRRSGPQLLLQGIDGTNSGANAQVDSSGAFTLEKILPGRYRVMWTGGTGYVKSIRLGPAEMADGALDLSNGAAGAALIVIVSAQFACVSGTVQADGASTAGLRVLLLPDSQAPAGRMGMQFGGIGAGGSYSFDRVIPGKYELAAIAEDDLSAVLQGGGEWEAYAPVTETVTIGAGEKAAQDLKLLKR